MEKGQQEWSRSRAGTRWLPARWGHSSWAPISRSCGLGPSESFKWAETSVHSRLAVHRALGWKCEVSDDTGPRGRGRLLKGGAE
jgi:hypothetical protein